MAVAYTVYDQETYGFSVGAYDTARPLIIDPLLASTFIGGSNSDYVYGIAIDSAGSPFVAGCTGSTDYPTTAGAFDCSYNGGGYDVFVSKLSSDLSSLTASSFIGGGSDDRAFAIAIDSAGSPFVAGWTRSTNYPTTAGAFDSSYNGGDYDVFVSKLSSDLSSLTASTFIGSIRADDARAITIDSAGSPFVAGFTYSTNYPTTAGAYDVSHNGNSDVFVSKLSSDLSSLSASTFIGGSSADYAEAIAIDSAGSLFVAGYTGSTNYPTTAGAYDVSPNGNSDVFVSKLDWELSKICACDADGNPKEKFLPGESVYVWGNGLPGSTNYMLWIQDEGVSEGKTLDAGEDPSAAQETNATDGSGTLAVTEIWAIGAGASVTYEQWDIVADKQNDGTNTGKYNAASDGIDSASVAGFVAPVPEAATVVLFAVGLVVLAGYVWTRKRRD